MSINDATLAPTPASRRARGRITAALVALALVSSGTIAAVSASAATPTYTDIVLGVGSDQEHRIVTWYSAVDTAQVAQLALASDVVDGVFPTKQSKVVTVPATGGPTTSGEFNRFVTFEKLKQNTEYVYRVGAEGDWSLQLLVPHAGLQGRLRLPVLRRPAGRRVR